MADKDGKLVLDEKTGQLVFTVETVYLFPELVKKEDSPSKTDVNVENTDEDKKDSHEIDAFPLEAESIDDKASSDKDSGLMDVKSLPDGQEESQESDEKENVNTLSKSEANSSPYSTPKIRGPNSWAGPRPWMVTGKGESEVLPLHRKGIIPHSEPVGGRPRTPPINVKSPKIRSAPQSPTGRYPWTSVLRNRSDSTGKSPRDYIEKQIPINFEDEGDENQRKSQTTKDPMDVDTKPGRGHKRPLVRLFPKPTVTSNQATKVSRKTQGQGQYEAFDSSSWSHVASEENFEYFPHSPDLEHVPDSDLKHEVNLTSNPADLEVTTRSDHTSTKHSKHVTDSSTAESETTTNVTSDHTVTFDPATGTTIKTFKERVEEVTTLTATITTDSRALESTGGRLRSSSLVKEFLDELEFSSRKRSSSFPEKEATKSKKGQLSVPGTPLSARSPRTPGSDIIEFACGVKFEKHSPSPNLRSDRKIFEFDKNRTDDASNGREAKPNVKETGGDTPVPENVSHVSETKASADCKGEAKNTKEGKQPKELKTHSPNQLNVPTLHVDEGMSLEDMLDTLKTYLSSADLLNGSSSQKPVEDEIKLKYEESKFRKTSTGFVETEHSEEIYIHTGAPKVIKVEPELDRTLETIRGMLSTSTEFLDCDVDVEDLSSPFEKEKQAELRNESETVPFKKDENKRKVDHLDYTTVFVEVLHSMSEVLHRTTDEIDLCKRPTRQRSKSESEFEDTLNTVREFLASDAEVLNETSEEDTSHGDDSDMEKALESVTEALHISSDCDSDYDNITQKVQWQPLRSQRRAAYEVDVNFVNFQTTNDIPFQRYVNLESNVPDVDIDTAYTINFRHGIPSPDHFSKSEHTEPNINKQDPVNRSEFVNVENVDVEKLSSENGHGIHREGSNDDEVLKSPRPYEQQMSTEFTPNLLQLQVVDIDLGDDVGEPKDGIEVKCRSDSGSVDFEDPPRECSSPQGDSIEVLYSKPLKKADRPAVIKDEEFERGKFKSVPLKEDYDDTDYETIRDVSVVPIEHKDSFDPIYATIKDDAVEQQPPTNMGAQNISSSESSMNDPEFMFDDDNSSLSILSQIGNTQSDFGSTEYLFVDLDNDLTTAEEQVQDQEDERRCELENQFELQREVESMLENFEKQQEIMKKEEMELMAKFKEGNHEGVREEVCEEIIVQSAPADRSFDILEDIRIQQEIAGKIPRTTDADVMTMEQRNTKCSTGTNQFETLEEITTRLESQIVDIETSRRDVVERVDEGNKDIVESAKSDDEMFGDWKKINSDEDKHKINAVKSDEGSDISSDESSRSLEDDLATMQECTLPDECTREEELRRNKIDHDVRRHVTTTDSDIALSSEEASWEAKDGNHNEQTFNSKEIEMAREVAVAELEELLRFESPEKSDTSENRSSSNESTPKKEREAYENSSVNLKTGPIKKSGICEVRSLETGEAGSFSISPKGKESDGLTFPSDFGWNKGSNVSKETQKSTFVKILGSTDANEKDDMVTNIGLIDTKDVDGSEDMFISSGEGVNTKFEDMGEEPLPISGRADRLSMHREESFNSFENHLEAISAENFSSSSESSFSLDDIGPQSELMTKRKSFDEGRLIIAKDHTLKPPNDATKHGKESSNFRSWPRVFKRNEKETKTSETKPNEIGSITRESKKQPGSLHGALRQMTENMLVSKVPKEDVKHTETEVKQTVELKNTMLTETSFIRETELTVTEFKYEEIVQQEVTLSDQPKTSENDGTNNDITDIRKKDVHEPQHELTVEEIVSRLRNKGDGIGYKPVKRIRRAATGKYLVQENSSEERVSESCTTEMKESMDDSNSSISSDEELEKLLADCKENLFISEDTDDQVHVTSFAQLQRTETEVRKVDEFGQEVSSFQRFVSESKSDKREDFVKHGGKKEENLKTTIDHLDANKERGGMIKDPRKMTIDEIVSSLPGAKSFSEFTRSGSFGSRKRPVRKISEPSSSTVVRSQSFGSTSGNISKPRKKGVTVSLKNSPVPLPKHTTRKGQFISILCRHSA